jgi:uncharacterized protein DUF2865
MWPVDHKRDFQSRLMAIVAIFATVALLTEPASAGGLFDMLFGNMRREPAPQALSYAPAAVTPGSPRPALRSGGTQSIQQSSGAGHGTTYCVRLCDGRYFPIQRHANANPTKICSALCPSVQTQIFSGADVKYSVAANGMRYSGLPNAFLYRKQLVKDCTCNGKDHFGLARIDPKADPTTRPGDIVVTSTAQNTTGHSLLSRTTAESDRTKLPN